MSGEELWVVDGVVMRDSVGNPLPLSKAVSEPSELWRIIHGSRALHVKHSIVSAHDQSHDHIYLAAQEAGENFCAECARSAISAGTPACRLCARPLPSSAISQTAIDTFPPEVALELAGVFCVSCLDMSLWSGNFAADSRICDAILIALLPRLARALGRVPGPDWRRDIPKGRYPEGQTLELLELAFMLPSTSATNAVYGNWLRALTVAGLVGEGLKSGRGVRSVANDGHSCFSMGERLIDDWLSSNGVDHEREPLYPDSRRRGDFLVNGKFIEYFGLASDEVYDKRATLKLAHAKEHGIEVIPVYPIDLATWDTFQTQFAESLGLEDWSASNGPVATITELEVRPENRAIARSPLWEEPSYIVGAGYYPDPWATGEYRWNNGHAWTFETVTSEGKARSSTPIATQLDPDEAEFVRRTNECARTQVGGRLSNGEILTAASQTKARSDLTAWASACSPYDHEADPNRPFSQSVATGPLSISLVARLWTVADLYDQGSFHEREIGNPYQMLQHVLAPHSPGAAYAIVNRELSVHTSSSLRRRIGPGHFSHLDLAPDHGSAGLELPGPRPSGIPKTNHAPVLCPTCTASPLPTEMWSLINLKSNDGIPIGKGVRRAR